MLAFLDHFGIAADDPRVNPYGGAIALGHPLASSGVRLMIHLARAFREHPEVRYGLTTMCIGLGMGGTVIWENPHHAGRAVSTDERRTGATAQRASTEPPSSTTAASALTDRRGRHPRAQPRRRACPHGAGTGGADHPGQRPGPHPAQHPRPARPGRAATTPSTPPWPATTSPRSRSPASRSSWPPAPTSPAAARSPSASRPLAIARIGHAVFDKLHTAPMPTFAFVNGLALGGGLEVALHCHYRTVSAAARRHRAARVLPRHVPGLGRRLPAAQPDRRRPRRHGDHRERR